MAEIRDYVLALIVMGGVSIGLFAFYGDIVSQYGTSVPNITFINKTQQINAQVAQYKTATEGIKFTGIATIDLIMNLPIYIVTGIWNTLLISLGLVDIYSALITDTINFMHIPIWIEIIIIGSMTVVIIFEIISLYMKRKA